MSFTAVEILQEFSEAAEMGHVRPLQRVLDLWNRRWWQEEGYKTRRPRYVIEVDERFAKLPKHGGKHGGYTYSGRVRRPPTVLALVDEPRPLPKKPRKAKRPVELEVRSLAVKQMACPICGGVLEKREGMGRLAHLGGSAICRPGTASNEVVAALRAG